MKKAFTYLAILTMLITSLLFATGCGIDSSSLGASASISQPSEDTTAEEADVTEDTGDTEDELDVTEEINDTEDEYVEDQLVEDTQDEEVQNAEAEVHTYILNVNTKKFHYNWCKSVNQMKDKNKLEMKATRDEVIAEGYDPCKNCNP